MKKLILIFSLITTAITAQTTYIIQSNTYLTYNIPGKIIGQDTTKIIGIIDSWTIDAFQTHTFYYRYLKSDFSTVVKSDKLVLTSTQVDVLYNAIKSQIPDTLSSFNSRAQLAGYAGMKVKAAETFSTTTGNFDLKTR